MPTLLRNFRSRTISTQTGNESLIPFDILARALLAYYAGLGINHQSPLIHFSCVLVFILSAGNQSPIPFDTLRLTDAVTSDRWESITNPL